MQEIWLSVEGFEGLYEVSNMGNVKALERVVENNGGLQHKHERILKPHYSNGRYAAVVLCKDGKTYPRLIHRLVAMAFIPNPKNKPCVDHIDTNHHNNHADNLRWVSVKENVNNPITRQHMSASKMGHPKTLDHHTDETKEKLRLLNLGKKCSEEAKQRMSNAHKGKSPSASAVVKAANANRGKHRSDEVRQKIRQASLGRHKGMHWKVEDGKRVWY